MKTAYLGLGSNLGDRRWCLSEAVRRLGDDPSLRIDAVSSVFESKPVGKTDQPDFLNLVLAVATSHAPEQLLARCLQVEADLGRVRHERWGPRTIDIDLLWHEGVTLATAELTLPHPRMLERSFVMIPLAEIAPQLLLRGQTAAKIAARLDQTGINRLGALKYPGSDA
ncbi:MAG: 2-amino-4-hydroxy-6-hydroxymethyldihydropteridine diphosphokinase [Opitutaceae bacterium]